MEIQEEIRSAQREQRTKLTYYIIALSVTSIGFVVTQTSGKPLAFFQIPIGLSVLSWLLSVWLGIRSLNYYMDMLEQNYAILIDREAMQTNNQELYEKAKESERNTKDRLLSTKMRFDSFFRLQEVFFTTGIVLYLIGHFFQMYLNT